MSGGTVCARMADPFESELEELVSRYARELSREITALILRRLGIGPAAGAPRRAARGGLVTARPRARAARAQRAPARRARSSAAELSAVREKVLRIVANAQGLSLGQIERSAGL